MRIWKGIVPCLGLLILGSTLSQVSPEVRRSVYRVRAGISDDLANMKNGWPKQNFPPEPTVTLIR